MRRRPWLLAAAAWAGAATPWLQAVQAQEQATEARLQWPPIELLDGHTLSPASWQGQAAVVVFWSTDCPYCRRHNAHLNTLAQHPSAKGLRLLGVALDGQADEVRRYMRTHGYGFATTWDGGALRQRLGVRRVIPLTCLISSQGRLALAIPGEMSADDVMDLPRLLQRHSA